MSNDSGAWDIVTLALYGLLAIAMFFAFKDGVDCNSNSLPALFFC